MKKLFIFLIIGLFLISFISAEEYKEVKYNEYKILSQTNLELAYDVSFSKPDINGTITISACVENETKELIDLKVDKEWYEKIYAWIIGDKSDYKYINYTFIAPELLTIETDVETSSLIRYNESTEIPIEKEPTIELGETKEICFKYSANPFDTPYIKLGDNSIIIIQDSDWITTSTLTNVTAETGLSNHTHLNVSNTAPWDSLVGYWSADGDLADTKLTTAYDWSGEGNDGTMADDAVSTSSAGKYGKGFSFDGDGDYVDMGEVEEVEGLSQFTIVAWWKQSKIEGNKIIVSKSNAAGQLTFRFSVGQSSNYEIIHLVTYNDDVYIGTHSGWLTYDSGWHFSAGVYNGTHSYFYNNGQLVGTPTANVGLTKDSNSAFRIGTDDDNADYFNGSIDDVMIFNTSLTPAQILEIYNNQSARFLDTGTQDITNQTYMNISTGNNRVNVSTQIQELMGSDINLTVGYYNGSWLATDPQTISSLTNYTFVIDDASTNITLNYTFIAGNDTTSFYTPLILGDISVESFTFVSDGDSCTYDVGNWEINCADDCSIDSNVDLMGNNFSTYGTGTITLTANITNYTLRTFRGTDSNNKCVISGIGGWFQSSG